MDFATLAADTGLRCDQTARLNSAKVRRGYPEAEPRISYIAPETKLWLIFFINQFAVDALTVALIYKHRWRIELFFCWIVCCGVAFDQFGASRESRRQTWNHFIRNGNSPLGESILILRFSRLTFDGNILEVYAS